MSIWTVIYGNHNTTPAFIIYVFLANSIDNQKKFHIFVPNLISALSDIISIAKTYINEQEYYYLYCAGTVFSQGF